MKYGAGFFVLRDNADKGAHAIPISSQTVLVGDLLDLDIGAANWTVAAASSVHSTRKAIAIASATSSDSTVLAIILDGNEDVQVQGANTSDSADNGDRMILTDKNTVNNTGTDDANKEACFLQLGYVGETTDNQIWGRVLVGSGVNPDAT